MPDWVTHLGTTYLAADAAWRVNPALARRFEMRHLLLGALLPDATRFTIILVDVLDWPAVATFVYLIPFHSLLLVGFIGGAIALLAPAATGGSLKAFGLIMLGAAFHFLLDDLEGLIGCGSTTFYPFYFGKPLNGWNSEGSFAATLLVVSAIGLGLALARCGNWSPLAFRFTRQRLGGAALLLAIALILPLFFRQRMIDQNAYYLAFVAQPASFEGQPVELCFSEVIATRPVTIEEFDTPFALNSDLPLNLGQWVSARGIYRNGAIQPQTVITHRGFADVHLSLIAAAVFVALMVDPRRLKQAAQRVVMNRQNNLKQRVE